MTLVISVLSPHSNIRQARLVAFAALEGSSLDNWASPLSCQPQNPAASFLVEAKEAASLTGIARGGHDVSEYPS